MRQASLSVLSLWEEWTHHGHGPLFEQVGGGVAEIEGFFIPVRWVFRGAAVLFIVIGLLMLAEVL